MSTGYDLGVDIYELWYAGKHVIPTVATEFDAACDSLGGDTSGAFYRGGGLGSGGSYGPHSSWAALQQTLFGHIAQTYNNLYYVGEALTNAANDYALTDQAARDEFDKRKQQLGDS